MSKFYILMLVLLVIAIINLIRACKEQKSFNKTLGITINTVAVVLLAAAMIIGLSL